MTENGEKKGKEEKNTTESARKDWELVRSIIEHENNLVNNRITWLLTTQGFLFTALILLFRTLKTSEESNAPLSFQNNFLEFSIPIFGIAISIFVRIGLWEATKQIYSVDNWWHKKYFSDDSSVYEMDGFKIVKKLEEFPTNDMRNRKVELARALKEHPPLQRGNVSKRTSRLRMANFPVIFIVMWCILIIFLISQFNLNF